HPPPHPPTPSFPTRRSSDLNVHLPEPMQRCEARSVGSAGMPRFSTYLELANSPRTTPGYDLIRRDESLGERTLKNTSISSFGSWSKADEYVSSSTLRSGNASINLLSRGAIASRAIVMGQATRNKPEGLARF